MQYMSPCKFQSFRFSNVFRVCKERQRLRRLKQTESAETARILRGSESFTILCRTRGIFWNHLLVMRGSFGQFWCLQFILAFLTHADSMF